MQQSQKIFIVDDDDDLMFLLKNRFQLLGHFVETSTGSEAVEEQLISFRPDIILLDVHLRGSDGRALCRKLKQDDRFNATRILIMSGHHDIAKISAFSGADGYVTKPVDFDMMEKQVSRTGS